MTYKEQFKLCADGLRSHILNDANAVKDLMKAPLLNPQTTVNATVVSMQPEPGVDPGEAKANIMLAYRHLEDARMRLGKAIQATEGGVSCYDKKP